jgi:hypothetical protein
VGPRPTDNADVADSVVEIKYFTAAITCWLPRGNPCTRTLQDHQSSPVDRIPAGVTADRTETVVHWQTVGTKPVPDLDVRNVEFTDDGTTAHLIGDVENNDNQRLRAIQVCAAFFNDDDEIVRAGRVIDPALEDGAARLRHRYQGGNCWISTSWADATTCSPTDVTDRSLSVNSLEEARATPAGSTERAAADVGGGFETTPKHSLTTEFSVSTTPPMGESHRYYNYDIEDERPDDVEIDGMRCG